MTNKKGQPLRRAAVPKYLRHTAKKRRAELWRGADSNSPRSRNPSLLPVDAIGFACSVILSRAAGMINIRR
jgi:hypothetical protein